MFEWLLRPWSRLRNTDIGDAFVVENKGRHRAANPVYFAVRLRHGEGEDPYAVLGEYLFTEHEIQQASDRAGKNPEDLPWNEAE